jgi:hypothetical protein
MIIHNAAITGSLTLNGIDISDITGSEASVGALNSFSSSILSYTASNDAKITALNAQTASILSYTSSNDAKIAAIYTATSSLNASVSALNSYTSSNTMNVAALFAASASLSASAAGLNLQTASLLSYTSSNDARVSALNSFSSSILSYTSSTDAKISAVYGATSSLQSATSSLNAFSGSILSYTSSTDAKITSIYTTTASLNASVSSLNTYTSSLNAKTASFATTGSNTFTGQQYISDASQASNFTSTASFYTDGGARITKDMYVSGTAYFNNITVFGTQSVSYISSSQLNIGTNLITVNTDTPSVRFGGLAVYDSGSTGLTGSILWDSQNNHWVYSNPSGSSYSGGMLISGPRSSALGSEQGTTLNALMKGQGGDHMTSSAVFDVSGSVGIGTSSPAYTLDVQGIYGQSTTSTQPFVIYGDSGDTNGLFRIQMDSISDSFGTGARTFLGDGGIDVFLGTGNSSYTPNNTYIALNYSGEISMGAGAATKHLVINTSGNVGIGTSSPGVKLYVSASDADYATIIKNTNTSGYGLQVLTAGSSTNLAFQVRTNNASTNAFQVLDNGNVGIGTTSPVTLLDVRGEVSVAYNATYGLRFYNDARNNWSYIGNSISGSSAANLRFGDSTGEVVRITGGNVGIGTTSPSYTLNVSKNVAGDYVAEINNTNTTNGYGLRVKGANGTSSYILSANDGTNEVFIVRGDGRVGIGTTSPSEKLHTIGNVKIEQTSNTNAVLTLNPNSGTLGTGYQWNLVGVNSGGNYAFQIREASSTYLTITNSAGGTGGNIGIGTTSPQSGVILDIRGAGAVAGGSEGLRIGNVGDNSAYDNVKLYYTGFNGGAPRVYLTPRTTPGSGVINTFFHLQNSNGTSTSSNNTMGLIVDGNVGIGNTGSNAKLEVNASTGEVFRADAASGAYRIIANQTQVLLNGNVGIGTTSPAQKLEVVGGEIKAGRVDSSNEGGQVSFGRASDNATGYYIDLYGSTSTPELRFVDVSNNAVRMSITSGGALKMASATISNNNAVFAAGELGGYKYFQGTLASGEKFGSQGGTYVLGFYFITWFDGASTRGYAMFATTNPTANAGTVLISSGGGGYAVSASYNASNAISLAFDGSSRGAVLSNNTGVGLTFYAYVFGGV